MEQEEKLIQTGVMSALFLGILVGLGVLEENYVSGAFTNPTLVGISLVPLLFFLVVTGRLQRFSGGGFEIVLQEQARKFVSPDASEEVHEYIDPERLSPKRRMSELEMVAESEPTALTLELGREGFYSLEAIEDYLETVETLRYVVFTDADGQFEGYATVDDFSQLVKNGGFDVIDEIETDEITDREIVRTDAIGSDTTNRDCLRKMDAGDVTELAVIGSDEQFVGVVTQDAIIRNLMSSAIKEA